MATQHGLSTQDTADYLHGCLPRDVTHRQVLWQSRRVRQALAASTVQRSLRGGVSLRPSLAACTNEGQRNFVPSGSRASNTVMSSVKRTFLPWLLRLGRRRTTCTGMRNVSCSCYRTSASDIRQPKCWPEGTSIHLPGKDAGIFTHSSSSKEWWRQTDPEVIDNLAHQHFIWRTSLLEYFVPVDSRNLLVFSLLRHTGV